jgi:hypothetical protein
LDALVQYLQGFNITFRYHHATDTNATALDSNSTHPFNLNYTFLPLAQLSFCPKILLTSSLRDLELLDTGCKIW